MSIDILIVDDEQAIADLVEVYLKNEGYTVHKFGTAAEALACVESVRLDLAILDVMLPDMDGFTLCQKIRQEHLFPILMLTARVEDMDKITGLTLGADDYINKPFRPRELVSRIRSVLRRKGKSQKLLKEGSITVDTVKGIVYRNGEELALSALEYRLLLIFFNNKGVVLSRGRLLSEIWDVAGEFVNDNTLTVYIKRLREKIEEDPSHPELIKTVRGMGYRL